MGKRVVTRATVDESLAAGAHELVVAPGDIVTALAREHAQERGLRLVAGGAAPQAVTDDDVAAIRARLIAALGYEPEGLAGVIERACR